MAISCNTTGATCTDKIESLALSDGNVVYSCLILRIYPDGLENSFVPGLTAGCSPSPIKLSLDALTPRPANMCGSIIDVDNLAVGEAVPIVGVDDELVYFSNRVRGRTTDFTVKIPVEVMPYQIEPFVHIRVSVMGQQYDRYFDSNSVFLGQTWDFTWDGKDASGNEVLSAAPITVEYLGTIDNYPDTKTYNVPFFTFKLIVGGWRAFDVGMGGWNFSTHHYYDPLKNWLYLGGGTIRAVEPTYKFRDGLDVIRDVDPVSTEFENVIVIGGESTEQVYIFDIITGRHLQTRSSRSGAVLMQFAYDVQGRLVSARDSFGNVTAISHSNGAVSIQAPRGQVTTLGLNASGWTQSIASPLGRSHQVQYVNSLGLIASFTKPSGEVSTFNYNANGYLTRDQSTSGAFWDLFYTGTPGSLSRRVDMTSAEGRLYSYYVTPNSVAPGAFSRIEVSPSGATRQVTFIPNQSEKSVEATGLTVESLYAPDPRFQFNSPVLASTVYSSSASTNQLQVSNSRAQTVAANNFLKLTEDISTYSIGSSTTTSQYDPVTQTFSQSTSSGQMSSYSVSASDQLTQTKRASFLPVDFGYDSFGRLQRIQQGARVTQINYDSLGRVRALVNPLGQSTQFAYDLDGQLLTQTLPDGRVTSMQYDANGNVTSITPPSRPTHNLIYNLFDLIASYVAPSIGTQNFITSYAYNRDKQITSITKPDGQQVGFAYAPTSGLLSTIATPEGTYTRTYNLANQLTNLNSPSQVNLVYKYEVDLVREQKMQFPSFSASVQYGYESYLAQFQKVQPSVGAGSQVSLVYDVDRRLSAAGDMSIVRDSASGLISGTQLGGVSEEYSYDSQFGEPQSYTASFAGSTIFSESFVRDALGRISTKNVTEGGVTHTFAYTYDSSGRLTEVYKDSAKISSYTYDANSNRTQVARGTAKTKATYDVQDRLLTYGARKYTYTLQGDRLIRYTDNNPTSTEYGYDSLGALTKVIKTSYNATTATTTVTRFDYANDGFGRRVTRLKEGVVLGHYVYDEQTDLLLS